MKLKPVGGNMILSEEDRRKKTLDTRPSGVFGTPGNEQSGIFPEGWEERLKESENKIKQAVRFEEKKTPPQSIREPKTYEFPAANNAVLSPVTKEKIAQDKKTLMDITSKDWATRYIFDPLTSNIKELRPLNKFLTAPAKITDEERRNLTPQQLRERQEEISLLEASGATRLYEKMSSYERMVYDEKQRESYYYEKEFDDALAAAIKADPKDFELKEGYEEPTSAVGMFIEDIKYSKHGFLDIAMSKSLEANLRMIGAGPDVLEWAEKIAINAKIDLLRRPELFAPEGLDMGDARWWTSTLANQVTFWATVFAASAGGAIVGSIAGTGAAGGAMTGGYLMGAGIEQGMAYDAMTEQGISPWEADWGSMVYGAAASYIENALGTKPGTVLSSMLKKNAVRSFKKTTLKGLMEKGAIKALMVAKTAGEEGLEEIVQGFTQNLVSSWFDENQALFTKDLWEQFKGGLAGGLLFGVIGAGGGASFKSLTIEEIGRVLPNELTSAQMGIQNELTNLKESIDKEGVDREFVVKKMVELKDSFNEIEAGKDRILKVGLTIEDITQKTFKNLTPRQQAIATDMIVLMEDVGKEGITKESVAKRLKQLRTEFNLIEENKRDMPSLGLTIKDVNKGKPIEEIKPKKSVIPKELQPLATEAKKFDSAEEFFLRMDKGVRDLLVNQGIRSQEAIKNFWNNNVEKVVQKIDSVNPTGSLYVDYKPQERMTLELGENMTTLDKTSGKSSDEMITVYRGAPKIQKEIVPGDFITTNYELAKSYTGEDNILEKEVRMGDILDDIKEPLGEEYIYRPQATKEVKPVVKAKPKPKKVIPATAKEQIKEEMPGGTVTRLEAEKVDMIEQASSEVWAELDNAEAGARFMVQPGTQSNYAEWLGSPSTFPSWLPDGTRTTPIVTKVKNYLISNRRPTRGKNIIAAYNAAIGEIVERSGITPAEMKSYYSGKVHEQIKEIQANKEVKDKLTPVSFKKMARELDEITRQPRSIMADYASMLTPGDLFDYELVYAEKRLSKFSGDISKIIKRLSRAGVRQEIIKSLTVDGSKIQSLIKLRREKNGEVSGTISRKLIKYIRDNFNYDADRDAKWIRESKFKRASGRVGRIIQGYETGDRFFRRLGSGLYNTIFLEARRGEKEAITYAEYIKEVELADVRALNKKESEELFWFVAQKQDKDIADNKKKTWSELSDNVKKAYKAVRKAAKNHYPEVKNSARMRGIEVREVKNYGPLYTSDDISLVDNGNFESYARRDPYFGSTKEREIDVPIDMYEKNYKKVMDRWADGVARYVKLGDRTVKIKFLIESEEFRNIVGEKIASKLLSKNPSDLGWYTYVVNPPKPTDKAVVAKGIRNLQALSILGFRYSVPLKQPLNIIDAIGRVGIKSILKGGKAIIMRSELARYAKKSGTVLERSAGLTVQDLKWTVTRWASKPTEYADRFTAILLKVSVMEQQLQRMKDEGIRVNPKLFKKAEATADAIVEGVMGGMSRAHTPKVFRSESGKHVNMFYSQLNARAQWYFDELQGKWPELATMPKSQKAVVVGAIAKLILTSYLETVVSKLAFFDEPDEVVKDVVSSLVGNIPLLGPLWFAATTGQPWSPVPAWANLMKIVSNAAEGEWGDALLEGTAFSGMPRQIINIVEGSIVVAKGRVEHKGNLVFEIEGGAEKIRTILRGKWGSMTAREYFRKIDDMDKLQQDYYDIKEDKIIPLLEKGKRKEVDKVVKEYNAKVLKNIKKIEERYDFEFSIKSTSLTIEDRNINDWIKQSDRLKNVPAFERKWEKRPSSGSGSLNFDLNFNLDFNAF